MSRINSSFPASTVILPRVFLFIICYSLLLKETSSLDVFEFFYVGTSPLDEVGMENCLFAFW